MRPRNLHHWMWADALTLLDEAERLRRQFFRLRRGHAAALPRAEVASWEPPVDLIETADALFVIVALPGAEDVGAVLTPDGVVVSALRRFPAMLPGTRIHRVEIPYGRFERHIALPLAQLELTGRTLRDGCLTLVFSKKEEDIA